MKLNSVKKMAKNKLVVAAVALIVLVGVFVMLQSGNSEAPAPVREFNLEVQNGKLTEDIRALTAYQGQTLVFNVAGDAADELHIHGYDKTVALKAGETAQLEFEAGKTGRFELELHEAGQQLTFLEVNPQP